VVLAVARANPTDGTRMVAALAGRELGGQVNRKRAQRLMREHRLLQRRRSEGRRQRPVIETAAADRDIAPGRLTLGTDNGSAFTSRAFRARLAGLGITHRRGGYRDPESQAFIESWFSKLKQRCIWREEFETLDQARATIAAYIDRYHHRPHSGLAYRTPREVATTWQDHRDDLTPAA